MRPRRKLKVALISLGAVLAIYVTSYIWMSRVYSWKDDGTPSSYYNLTGDEVWIGLSKAEANAEGKSSPLTLLAMVRAAKTLYHIYWPMIWLDRRIGTEIVIPHELISIDELEEFAKTEFPHVPK